MKKIVRRISVLILVGQLGFISYNIPYKTFNVPYKPYKFATPFEKTKFLNESARYKREVEEFIAEEGRIIKLHMAAQKKAKDDWNRFAKYQLGDPSKQFKEK